MKIFHLFTNRLFLLLFAAAIVVIAGGVFLWQRHHPASANTTTTPTPSKTKSAAPQYPKVETYQVPILMYHYIRNAEGESELGKGLSVSPQNFDAHLKWLADNNYETLKVSDLADPDKTALSKIASEKKKPVAITFDDGYLDAYTNALPVLKKYNATATFYIIRKYVGKPEYMNQAQIDELEKFGYEIGSHTLSHPDLTKIDLGDAQKQIFDSKSSATAFCYPAGKYDATTVKLVQEAGYTTAVTTHFGIASEKSSILELPRVRVENGSGETLGFKIEAAFEQTK